MDLSIHLIAAWVQSLVRHGRSSARPGFETAQNNHDCPDNDSSLGRKLVTVQTPGSVQTPARSNPTPIPWSSPPL
jgi:hypothetical protein